MSAAACAVWGNECVHTQARLSVVQGCRVQGCGTIS